MIANDPKIFEAPASDKRENKAEEIIQILQFYRGYVLIDNYLSNIINN